MADKVYDVKAILFHIGEKGRSSHKAINYPSFVRTLQDPKIHERLIDGKLLGLLTHDERSVARRGDIPHHDLVMKSPDLCNILREVTTKDGVVYGYLDLTDTPAAQRFKSLYKQGCKIGVSISTDLVEGDEFEIRELFGVDFTLRPEFDTPIVEANFSEGKSKMDSNYKADFSFNAKVDPSETVLLSAGDFSEKLEQSKVESRDFAIRDYLRERQRTPAMVLRNRIMEVIRYAKMCRAKAFDDSKTYLRRYILEYLNEWVTMSIANPNSNLNIALGLRLSEYCKNRTPMRDLQRYLMRARQQLNQTGSMTKEVQTNLNRAFVSLMDEIYSYINEKIGDEDKKL